MTQLRSWLRFLISSITVEMAPLMSPKPTFTKTPTLLQKDDEARGCKRFAIPLFGQGHLRCARPDARRVGVSQRWVRARRRHSATLRDEQVPRMGWRMARAAG